MTGAPKLKSMDILENLENAPRGGYSGIFGFLSVDGTAEFNVLIRSAFFDLQQSSVSVGAGGAIVYGSVPKDEWDEMILKSNSVRGTLRDLF